MPGRRRRHAVRKAPVAKNANFHIGTSGYEYNHWRGVFYPKELPHRDWFGHYAEAFDTVEMNNTFYSLPEGETFDAWRDRAPQRFLYALKFSRYGSHLKHLKNPKETIGLFIKRAERLGPHLGPILVQLPPQWNADAERLDAFLDAAPPNHLWAVEFRNPSWLGEPIYDVLRRHRAALCLHDLIEDHPEVQTTGWIYRRFHGAGKGGAYSHQALTAAAQRIKANLADGADVFAYFNNDAQGFAVDNARALKRYVLG